MSDTQPPDDSLAWKVWLGSIVSVALATLAVALRLVARRISSAPFWWDDCKSEFLKTSALLRGLQSHNIRFRDFASRRPFWRFAIKPNKSLIGGMLTAIYCSYDCHVTGKHHLGIWASLSKVRV